ncbi:hypothetical protein Q7P37_008302 [Cladosporium fusiforme]
MAPSRAVDDDPVTAEYDVYLTAAQQEQIYLLHYLNRTRERPYSQRFGAQPVDVRIKPNSGHLELDVELSTNYNFNKYQGLKWGDAVQASKTIQNDSGTYGPASGFGVPRGKPGGRNQLKDKADIENQVGNDLAAFRDAVEEEKVMNKQTLGGQIFRHDNKGEDMAQPVYFLGAFAGNQLHLSKVDGTVQMRPQFHHIDAEAHRNRLATSRATAEADGAPAKPAPVARALADAEEESWVPLEYVDEAEEAAFELFHERMFLHDAEQAHQLNSGMDDDTFLDAVSMPREGSPHRKRKRPPRKRDVEEGDGHAEAAAGEEANAVEGAGEEAHAGGESMEGVAEA